MQCGRYGNEDPPSVFPSAAQTRNAWHKEALFFPKYLAKATIRLLLEMDV
jgi:hypothetical protein